MKRPLLAFLISFFLITCESEHPVKSPVFLDVSKKEIILGAGTTRNIVIGDTLTILSNNEWQLINGSPSLFEVDRRMIDASKSILTITTQPNTTFQERVAKIVVFTEGLPPVEITVRQEKARRLDEIAGAGEHGFQDGSFEASRFNLVWGLSFNRATETLYAADHNNFCVRSLDLRTRQVSTLAKSLGNLYHVSTDIYGDVFVGGSGLSFMKISGDGSLTHLPGFEWNLGAFTTNAGSNMPFYGIVGNVIQRVDRAYNTTNFAGATEAGFMDGPGPMARFNNPMAITTDGSGNLIVTDNGNASIRQVTVDGHVSTVIGNGERGYRDGALSIAMVEGPGQAAAAGDGTIYFIDGSEIRKISADRKRVTTIEFNGEISGQLKAIHAVGQWVFFSAGHRVYRFDNE